MKYFIIFDIFPKKSGEKLAPKRMAKRQHAHQKSRWYGIQTLRYTADSRANAENFQTNSDLFRQFIGVAMRIDAQQAYTDHVRAKPRASAHKSNGKKIRHIYPDRNG